MATTYKLRIGDYSGTAVKDTDYIEFYASGDPMPLFTQGRTNNYNADGVQISTDYNVNMTLFYPGSGSDPTVLWTKWGYLNTILDSGTHDIRLYYNDVLKMSYIKDGTDSATEVKCFNSPRITVVGGKPGKGQWATFLEFDVQFFIETDASTHSNILALDRQKETTEKDGVITRRWSITARGTGAYSKVVDFANGLTSYGKITMKSYTEQIDNDTWTGTFTVEKAANDNILEVRETIKVSGGGRDKEFIATLGDTDPYEFDGTRRPVIIEIEGEVTSTEISKLLIPQRDDLPGHVPDDEYSFGGIESDTTGEYSKYRGTYRQIFKLPNRDDVQTIVQFPKSAKSISSGKTYLMAVDGVGVNIVTGEGLFELTKLLAGAANV